MKKFLLIMAMSVMAIAVSAQDWYAGGQVTFGRTTQSSSGLKTTQVTVLPELGYYISDNFSVGAKLGVSYRKSGGDEKTVFVVDPYARCVIFSYERLSVFVDGGVDLGIGRAHGRTAVEYGIGFRPGLLLHLSDRFSLEAHVGFLGYQSGNRAAKDNGAAENWGLDLNGNNLMFGFQYHF